MDRRPDIVPTGKQTPVSGRMGVRVHLAVGTEKAASEKMQAMGLTLISSRVFDVKRARIRSSRVSSFPPI